MLDKWFKDKLKKDGTDVIYIAYCGSGLTVFATKVTYKAELQKHIAVADKGGKVYKLDSYTGRVVSSNADGYRFAVVVEMTSEQEIVDSSWIIR